MTNNTTEIEKKLRVNLKNKNLLICALTHKSFSSTENNEKLEFLGDRVIGLVLSKKLFDLYPAENEGSLDKKLANLVNKKTCCLIALSIGIQDFIIIGDKKKKINDNDEKILSDAIEALIGAVYIDKGYDFVSKFVLKLWKKNINKSNVIILDPKTQLQEFSLKNYKKLPIYRVIEAKGPKHKLIFKVNVSILGSKKFIGTGASKQQAELDAAKNLLNSKNIS